MPTPATAIVQWLMAPDAHELPSLESLIGRPAWMDRAACRGEPVSTFIAELGANYSRAREMCERCPVRSECLSYAVADPEIVGYWAGTTPAERKRLRRAAG